MWVTTMVYREWVHPRGVAALCLLYRVTTFRCITKEEGSSHAYPSGGKEWRKVGGDTETPTDSNRHFRSRRNFHCYAVAPHKKITQIFSITRTRPIEEVRHPVEVVPATQSRPQEAEKYFWRGPKNCPKFSSPPSPPHSAATCWRAESQPTRGRIGR